MAHTIVQTNRWQAAKTMQIYTAIHTNTHTHACVHRQVQLAIESAHLHLLLIFADNKVVSFESLESLCPLLLAGAEDCDTNRSAELSLDPKTEAGEPSCCRIAGSHSQPCITARYVPCCFEGAVTY